MAGRGCGVVATNSVGDSAASSSAIATTKVALAGDANLDGIVDVTDLGIVSSNWQQAGKNWSTGDFNGDGVVNVADLGMFATNWLRTA